MRVLVALSIIFGCNAQFIVRHGAPLMYPATPFTYSNLPGIYSSPSIYPWVPSTQYHNQDIFGQAHFGHATLDHTRNEVRLANGQVVGSFSYIDPNGETQVTQYEAGPQGYKVKATNLPVAPEDTPEVAAARVEHLSLKADAAPARKKRSAGLLSYVGLPGVVQSKVAEGDDIMPADVTKLSVTQLGLPLSYMHGIPFVSANPTLSVPAVVTPDVDSEEEDSGEVTTAVHAIPYTFPTFAATAAFPAVSKFTVETKQVDTVDAAVPADTTKLAITTQEKEFSIPTFKYVQPTIGNMFSYNNFPYNFYNYQTPHTYSGSAYPYHFGFPYNFGYTWAPTTYAAAVPEVEESSEEDD